VRARKKKAQQGKRVQGKKKAEQSKCARGKKLRHSRESDKWHGTYVQEKKGHSRRVRARKKWHSPV